MAHEPGRGRDFSPVYIYIYEREGPKSRYKSMTKGRRAGPYTGTRVLRNVHDETETTVTAGAKRASIISAYPFFPLLSLFPLLSFCSLPRGAFLLFFFSSAERQHPLSLSPPPFSAPPYAGRSSALLPPRSVLRSRVGNREERETDLGRRGRGTKK